MCPKCKKESDCGCRSCKKRRGISIRRANNLKGDYITCPYCRTKFYYGEWEDFSYERYKLEVISETV